MKRIDEADTTQALKLLMQEHRRIRRLLVHAEESVADPLAQGRATDLACRELEAHAAIEERLLYPLLRSLGGIEGVESARHDHDVAGQLIAVLDRLGPADGQFVPTLRELGEWVDEHVRREEATLLARANDSAVDLAPLARALLERQRNGALTDVDVDAERAPQSEFERPPTDDGAHDRQRERTPRRRGAH